MTDEIITALRADADFQREMAQEGMAASPPIDEPQPPEEPQGTDEPEDGPKIGNDGPDQPAPEDDDGEG